MGLRLFDVDPAIETLLEDPEVMDPETGELLNPAALEALEGEKERVVLHLMRAAKNAIAEGEAIIQAADKLKARGVARNNYAYGLKSYIANCCHKGDKFSDEYVAGNVQESQSVDVIDEAKIPPRFWVNKPRPDPTLNRKMLLDTLKSGKNVSGAVIARKKFTVIR